MIVRFFKSNSPSAFLLLPVLALAIWIFGFFPVQQFPLEHAMPLYELVAAPLQKLPWLGTLIAFLLCIGEGFLLGYIANENEVFNKKTNLTALFYVVFMSNNRAMLELHPLLFSNLFLLLAINEVLDAYRKDVAFSQAFNTGLFVSVATLFYFPSVVFLPVIGVSLIIFRPFHWREWVISFIGVLVPFLFVFTWYFWFDGLPVLLYDKILHMVFFKRPNFDLPQTFYYLMTIGWIIVICSFGKLFSGFSGGGPQKTKKAMLLTLWLFVHAIASVFLAPAIATVYFSLLAIPAAIICANFFLRQKKELWGEILFYLLLTGIFADLLNGIF